MRVDSPVLDRIRAQVLRNHQRNLSAKAVHSALAEAAWASVRDGDRAEFMERFDDHLEVDAFLAAWWPQVDPRDVLLWLADPERVRQHGAGVLTPQECDLFAASMQHALEVGSWSAADAALVDDLAARLGPVQDGPAEERGFYEIEEFEDVSQFGVAEVRAGLDSRAVGTKSSRTAPTDPRELLLQGRVEGPGEYAHVLVDEAQDLSPMQWRMLGRRGRYSSWTVVGDAAQASWPDAVEAGRAREEAFGAQERRLFHMDTNYRNAREIFDYAARPCAPTFPTPTSPRPCARPGSTRSTPTVATGWLGRRRHRSRRDPARRGRGLDRRDHPDEVCRGAGRAGHAQRPGAWSSTRCRPRASSTTPPSSSTPTRSRRSRPVGCGSSTSRSPARPTG